MPRRRSRQDGPSGDNGQHNDKDIGTPIQYDPTFNGPLRKRSCTDVLCLAIFFVFIACWIAIAAYAIKNGNPDVLLVPKDSSGARCGLDYHVKNKPNLFFFDLTKCLGPSVPFTGCNTPQVCVANCPKSNLYIPNNGDVLGSWNDTICKNHIEHPDSIEKARQLIASNDCAGWHLQSTKILNRCIYNVAGDLNFLRRDKRLGPEEMRSLYRKLNVSNSWLSLAAHNTIGFFTANEYTHQVGHDIVDDIEHSWQEVVGGIAIALVVCFIYIAMMRWIAGIMVWCSILATLALLIFCQYFTIKNYLYYKDNPWESEQADSPMQSTLKDATLWLVLLIIVAIVLSILLLVLIFLRKRIKLAVALIKEGSRAVSASTSTLCFPIFPWILQIGVIALSITIALYLASTGDPVYKLKNSDTECNPIDSEPNCIFVKMNHHPLIPYLHAFNVFAFFWGVFFISALGEMILAATFATWYWTFHKSDVPFFTLTTAILRTLRFHIGTLAFGSLIIAICRIIRVCLEYVDQKLKKYDNELTKALLCCCKCFFWCLEKFLKFINKNAYIMCAIHGKNFCSSAKDAFSLLLRNIIRVFVLDKVTDFLFFLSKIMVTIGVSCIVYAFLEFASKKQLHYNYVPVVFVAICTYLICIIFFSVYTMAVDTLFLCFLEDSERNDGSPEKPYFMSKNLMKILGKKNK